MTITVVTGLAEEAAIAKQYCPGALVLCGQAQRDALSTLVPSKCDAIMSFGLCGGLASMNTPEVPMQIGQIVIADTLVDGYGNIYMPDPFWRRRLFAATRAYEHVWFSSGLYHDADTPAQRFNLFNKFHAYCIDDESLAVSLLAQHRSIPFTIIRSISDGWDDTVPAAARTATNPDGTSNIDSVLAWLEAHPSEDSEEILDLVEIAGKYNTSINELRTCAIQLGQTFQWPQ
jgi:hypothetical protein